MKPVPQCAVLGAWLLSVACVSSGPAATPAGSGTLAISADGATLYVADADRGELAVVDAASGALRAQVPVGQGPVRVVVAPDGLVAVANRFSRSVSVVDPAAGRALASIPVGAEPVSIAFDGAGTLVVANHTGRSVSLVDWALRTERARVPVDLFPSGLAVVGGRAYVTPARSARVAVVDVAAGAVRADAAFSLELPINKTNGERRVPGQAIDPVLDAAMGRLYLPHVQGKFDPVPTDVPNAYAGSLGSLPVVANALATLDAATGKLLDAPGFDPARVAAGRTLEGIAGSTLPAVIFPVSGPVSGPAAALLGGGGKWLYVANRNSANVQLVNARPENGDVAAPAVAVGGGPSGLAIDATGRLYVHEGFDHALAVLEGDAAALAVARRIPLGAAVLTPQQELGRRLFHAADDLRMTNPAVGGIACASCHPGGREDGRVWQFTEGPRNTPTLAGRGLSRTAPYHWDGELVDLAAFDFVVQARMGGSGLTGADGVAPLARADFDAMLAWLETLPPPDDPAREQHPPEAVERGRALFEGKADCGRCHYGPDLTDNGYHDVGTFRTTESGLPERFDHGGVNTPPLHHLFATAPYLHDGSLETLEARVDPATNPYDRHGVTSTLTAAERADLVAYLKQL